MKTAQQILESKCPVFGALFLDKSNAAQMDMFKSIISAMEEYAINKQTVAMSDKIDPTKMTITPNDKHLLRGFDNWEQCARFWHDQTFQARESLKEIKQYQLQLYKAIERLEDEIQALKK